jgi:protein-S-isoprenylcysteine O-methyltransferase Ste14
MSARRKRDEAEFPHWKWDDRYICWTLLYLGGALITRNAWMATFLPLVGGIIHGEVLREEHALEGPLGEEYVRYRKLVHRYVW